jgi:hypothetical protein
MTVGPHGPHGGLHAITPPRNGPHAYKIPNRNPEEPDEDSPGDFVEFSSVNYANLPALVADGTYSALVPDSEQWFEGEVVKKRTGVYGYIDVLFDDQDADEDDAVRISVNATNRHYVQPDKYVKV